MAGNTDQDRYETLLYGVADAVATITLNRPERLNTIVPPMPDEVEAAVRRADARSCGQGDRASAARALVLRRLRLRRRLPPLGRLHHDRRRLGPRQGLRVRDRARAVARRRSS